MYLFVLSCLLIGYCQCLYRLPSTIEPIYYNITLKPIFNNSNIDFTGEEYISINISNTIFSNSTNFSLYIHKAPTIIINDVYITINSINYDYINTIYDTSTEMILITYNTTINNINTALLYFKYTGKYNTFAPVGVFKSSYVLNSVTIQSITAQFQPTFARYAFICFDEPGIKSVFNWNFIAPINAVVLYNMPMIDETLLNDYSCQYTSRYGSNNQCKLVKFQTSPHMSTYLNTFVIGISYMYIHNS